MRPAAPATTTLGALEVALWAMREALYEGRFRISQKALGDPMLETYERTQQVGDLEDALKTVEGMWSAAMPKRKR